MPDSGLGIGIIHQHLRADAPTGGSGQQGDAAQLEEYKSSSGCSAFAMNSHEFFLCLENKRLSNN